MRRLLLAASFAAMAAVPAVSEAQSTTRCERDQRNDRLAGTVVGAGVGALLGSAIAGNSSNTEGTIIGGVAGAIAGNQIAKSGSPCPPGYRVVAPAAAPPYGYNQAPPAYGYNQPPPAYGYNQGRVYDDDYRGYYDDRGSFNRERFWSGAPAHVEDRIAFLENRLRRGVDNGTITRREADAAFRQIADVRRETRRMRRDSYGRLSVREEAYLQRRLDQVSQQIQWARLNDNRRYR